MQCAHTAVPALDAYVSTAYAWQGRSVEGGVEVDVASLFGGQARKVDEGDDRHRTFSHTDVCKERRTLYTTAPSEHACGTVQGHSCGAVRAAAHLESDPCARPRCWLS